MLFILAATAVFAVVWFIKNPKVPIVEAIGVSGLASVALLYGAADMGATGRKPACWSNKTVSSAIFGMPFACKKNVAGAEAAKMRLARR